MKIESFMLADAAQAANGKLFVLGGGWSVHRAPNYPGHVQMALAFMVSFSSTEIGNKYPLHVAIADEAGVPIVPAMRGQIEVAPPAPEMPKAAPHKLPFALNMGLSIPRPGKYGIVVTVGSSKAQTEFHAIFVGSKVQFDVSETSGERGN
jgi:hypothetical protein